MQSPCWLKTFSFISLYLNTQETMEDIDKNADGVIDLEEYIGKSSSV